ncbi:hypothetical protein [Streptomyces sp. bgisy031]|uniref:hypothetical protein n=1 Tax=Streptomyces sp. bgisy031 TaxID=3413772 RepID=UPI003D73E97D
MTETRPGPDELRVRRLLRKHGVGPDALAEQPLPVAPTVTDPPAGYERTPDPDEWFTRLYGEDGTSPVEPATSTDTDPDPDPEPADDDPAEEPAPRERRRPRIELSRTSLADTLAALTPKQRWLLTHGTAAAAGWPIGLVNWGTGTAHWFAAGNWTSSSAWTIYGLAAIAISIYRRTRHRLLPVAWLAAVPVSSVALGVLLYGTA